ncbi:MAG: helix-turn-helix transcriptional regulator [Archangium sp.]|nr:helix-turn-helix transcriptional regulator [Archangium sp.]
MSHTLSAEFIHRQAKALGRRGRFTMQQLAEALGVSRATLYRAMSSTNLRRELETLGLHVSPRARLESTALTAARALVGAHGFSALTIEAVARESGVAQATLYRHFRSRAGLMKALIRSEARPAMPKGTPLDVRAPLEPVLAAIASYALRELLKVGWLIRATMLEPPGEVRRLMRFRDASQGTRATLTKYFTALRRRGVIQDDVEPRLAAETFLGTLLVRVLVSDVFTLDDAHIDVLAAHTARLFARGMLRKSP